MQNKNGKSSSWWQTLWCFQPGRGIHIRHHIIAGCAPADQSSGSGWSLSLYCTSLCTCELQSLGLYFPSGAQQIDFLFLLVLLEGLWHSLHLPDEFNTRSILLGALLFCASSLYWFECLILPWGPRGTSWFWDTRSDASIWTQTTWVKKVIF